MCIRDSFDTFPTVLNADNEPELLRLNGMRIRRFEDDRIVFAVFVFGTFNFAFSPRQTLYWDQPMTLIRISADNNEDFQEEIISTGSVSIDDTVVENDTYSDYASGVTIAADTLGANGMDPRTIQYDGSASSSPRTVSTTFTTNAGTTSTQTSTFSWAAGGFSGSGDDNGNTIRGNIPFDRILTTYDIDSNLRDTFDADNISLETATTDNGTLTHVSTTTERVRFRSTDATLYHDSTITGTISATFIRPTTVSTLDTDSRTFVDSDSWSYSANTSYRTWVYTSSTAFAESDLGTLSNDTGYALDHFHQGSSSTGWRNQDPYTFTNNTGSAVNGIIVAPSSVDPTDAFRDTAFNLPLQGITRTEIELGHTDHTVTYYVYTFNVGANSVVSFNVL